MGKTGVDGQLLAEAKYINMSLHHLEHVIVSLSEKNRKHVPYRNSMMTSVLRDSLGGNCMTTMIATCSVESKNFFVRCYHYFCHPNYTSIIEKYSDDSTFLKVL